MVDAPDTLTIRRPDDWHLHLRDGEMLRAVLPASARDFGRAIVMPNLVPPVVTIADATAYRERIDAATPGGAAFEPWMTLYLTEGTDPDDVERAARAGAVRAVKLYPAGATTNSQSGVRDWRRCLPVLERMGEIGLPLLVHGEVTDAAIDVFDREAVFLDRVLAPLREAVPGLSITLEHVTTEDGVAFVQAQEDVFASITVHHLMLDRNDLLARHMRPHYYCLPILKRRRHRDALRTAAAGDERFFLGTDSAPHPVHAKEAECCAAGCFTAPVALPCLAHAFEEMGALDRLEAFTSLNGARRYGVEPNDGTVTLERCELRPVGGRVEGAMGAVEVFDPGHPVGWRIVGA